VPGPRCAGRGVPVEVDYDEVRVVESKELRLF
jgi:hypothetical protein